MTPVSISHLMIHRWDVDTGGWQERVKLVTALTVEMSLALAVSPADVAGVQRRLKFRRVSGPGPGVYRVINEGDGGKVSFWKVKRIRR